MKRLSWNRNVLLSEKVTQLHPFGDGNTFDFTQLHQPVAYHIHHFIHWIRSGIISAGMDQYRLCKRYRLRSDLGRFCRLRVSYRTSSQATWCFTEMGRSPLVTSICMSFLENVDDDKLWDFCIHSCSGRYPVVLDNGVQFDRFAQNETINRCWRVSKTRWTSAFIVIQTPAPSGSNQSTTQTTRRPATKVYF